MTMNERNKHIIPGHCLEIANELRYIRNGILEISEEGEWWLTTDKVDPLRFDKPIIVIAAKNKTTLVVSIDVVGWMYYHDSE